MNSLCEIDDHAGIVATDPQLRTATLHVTNDYPCAVSGYWSLSIPVGYAGDELGGEIRAYRQVGSAWQEVFGGQQVLVTIGAGQTLEVPLLLEGAGWSSDTAICATFHAVNLADDALASGLLPAYEAHDSLTLEENTVDLCVGSMPEVYEDDLASVIPMNRDYDDGYVDSNQNPLPDNTDPLPTGATPPPAHAGEDDLPAGSLTFPYGFHGTWTMTVPAGLRVWQWTGSAWAEVQSGTAYARPGGGGIGLRVERLAAGSSAYLTVSAQFTDANDAPTGLPLTDRVKVEVVSVDLQIQNISEHDETTTPAFVIVNDDYDENDTHPISGEAVSDNNRLYGMVVDAKRPDGVIAPGIVSGDDDLVSATLMVYGPSCQSGKYWIEITGEPATLPSPNSDVPGYNQYVRVWLADGTPAPRTRESALSTMANVEPVELCIEGLTKYYDQYFHGIGLVAHFEPDGDYAKAGVSADVSDTAHVVIGVNGWTRRDWEATGPAIAIAGSDYDTLQQLAKDITGRAGDASLLANVGPITHGTEVNVRPLLDKLEERIRNNVKDAATGNKRAKFADTTDEIREAGNAHEKQINSIFGAGPAVNPRPQYDCKNMALIILARGVEKELNPGEFDSWFFDAQWLWDTYKGDERVVALSSYGQPGGVKVGDYTYFSNKADYPNVHDMSKAHYQGENVLVVGNDSYYGFDLGAKTYLQWLQLLYDEYNKGLINGGQPLPPLPNPPTVAAIEALIGGYKGSVRFFDVPKIAMKVFDGRTA